MNAEFEKVLKGSVVVFETENGWKIHALHNTGFLDWMRHTYQADENQSWQLWYYSGSMNIVEVIDEGIFAMISLRWL